MKHSASLLDFTFHTAEGCTQFYNLLPYSFISGYSVRLSLALFQSQEQVFGLRDLTFHFAQRVLLLVIGLSMQLHTRNNLPRVR